MVPFPYTVSNPWTVMIECCNTMIAMFTMFASQRLQINKRLIYYLLYVAHGAIFCFNKQNNFFFFYNFFRLLILNLIAFFSGLTITLFLIENHMLANIRLNTFGSLLITIIVFFLNYFYLDIIYHQAWLITFNLITTYQSSFIQVIDLQHRLRILNIIEHSFFIHICSFLSRGIYNGSIVKMSI